MGGRSERAGERPSDTLPKPVEDGDLPEPDEAVRETQRERARIEREAGDVADDLADFA